MVFVVVQIHLAAILVSLVAVGTRRVTPANVTIGIPATGLPPIGISTDFIAFATVSLVLIRVHFAAVVRQAIAVLPGAHARGDHAFLS